MKPIRPGRPSPSTGSWSGRPPLKVSLQRDDPVRVVVEKDGISETILFERHIDEGWIVIDLIFTLGIGIPIDLSTGSMIVVEKPKEKPRLRLNERVAWRAMPWELTIAHTNGHRLGSPKEVMAALAKVWPQLEWIENPPLLEQIRDHPDHPFHKLLPTWSAERRRRAALPTTVGVLEGDAMSFEISGIDEDPVEELYLDVRASADPSPALIQLKARCGWTLKEMATDRRLLDELQIRERWDNFRRLFDQAGS